MRAFPAIGAVLVLAAWGHVAAGREPVVADPAGHRAGDADTGFLDVSSDPPAKIFVDDADTGKTTPEPHLALKAGHHKLKLVTKDGAHNRTIGFTIEAGQTTKLSIHLAS
jgi:hypothetical protein